MKLRRLNPPLHLLRAFSSVVRAGGISRAAADLQLTQGAVSKQIQDLERWLEVQLFVRSGKRLDLTVTGAHYEKTIRPLLDQIQAATLGLISESVEGGALRVSAMPTFSAKWLVPRLPDFRHKHPGVNINFVPYVGEFDYRDSPIDCAFLFGDGKWPGAEAIYVDGREVILVAPPSAREAIRCPNDVQAFPLLRHLAAPEHWPRWQEINGVPDLKTLSGPQFDNYHAMIQAVVVGMGVALAPKCLVDDELAGKLLIAPLQGQEGAGYESEKGYWFCYKREGSYSVPLTLFRDWLLSQIGY
ncbi:MAG TPA: LysR substrate-binding domain-containing protein [Ramlibacter sp.]|nr:LysR substrate-binding domain-containing protein [Ramlibacter sp.]